MSFNKGKLVLKKSHLNKNSNFGHLNVAVLIFFVIFLFSNNVYIDKTYSEIATETKTETETKVETHPTPYSKLA